MKETKSLRQEKQELISMLDTKTKEYNELRHSNNWQIDELRNEIREIERIKDLYKRERDTAEDKIY